MVIAAGAYMPEKEQLAAIRHWMMENHTAFRKILNKPAVKKTFSEFEGEALTRPPKGFPPDHPAMDLIKQKQWGLSTTLPADAALEDDLRADRDQALQAACPNGGCAERADRGVAGAEKEGTFRAPLARIGKCAASARSIVFGSRNPAKTGYFR